MFSSHPLVPVVKKGQDGRELSETNSWDTQFGWKVKNLFILEPHLHLVGKRLLHCTSFSSFLHVDAVEACSSNMISQVMKSYWISNERTKLVISLEPKNIKIQCCEKVCTFISFCCIKYYCCFPAWSDYTWTLDCRLMTREQSIPT